MKTNRISASRQSNAAQELEASETWASSPQNMQIPMDTTLLQRAPTATQAKASDEGWENDVESFAKRLAEHHLSNERGISDKIEKARRLSAASSKTHECELSTEGGLTVRTLWQTETNVAIAKSCIQDDCKACAYNYTVSDAGELNFSLIKCWLIAPF
ncbi:hypothetical protein MUK70_01950 [Dyadobacter chenwenxiniae]|uniref:Uncharacterized protein n=1 Tax=Dyadobacter chenwenxiniae TaxID=2906456 RepID=A0A9X1PKL2_9BACT|nr:hypothetical protein [Dyadobacter chenwenxiniae]MCF0062491.1 hypothetical protein [Dyadobacter chenwenxiniae]UON83763.1 hypothetical protein MUK70_01950 [Dyadobacter chenwenxiniae]